MKCEVCFHLESCAYVRPILPACDEFVDKTQVKVALEKQIPKRVKAKSKRDFTIDDFKGIRNTRYYCPCCDKSVKHHTKCCDNCGQRLIFPQVRYSDYIEGVVQKRWLDWSEE